MNPKPQFAIVLLAVLTILSCGRTGPLPSPDKTPPSVTAVSPVNGAENVGLEAEIVITFNKTMAPASITTETVSLLANGSPVNFTVEVLNERAVVKPVEPLSENTRYMLLISNSVMDSFGNAMGTAFSSFFDTKKTAPRVVDIHPADFSTNVTLPTAISIIFSEPMDAESITDKTIKVRTRTGRVSYNPAIAAALFIPDSPFSPNTEYDVEVTTGAWDLSKTPMAESFGATFKTGTAIDATGPAVQPVFPPSGSSGAPLHAPIVIRFSEPVLPTTITPESFLVQSGEQQTVDGNLALFDTTLVFTPKAFLAGSTTYTVTAKAIKDLAENPMASDSVWSFSTTSAVTDDIPPSILRTFPGPGSASDPENVRVYKQIAVIFTEAMLASSVTSSTFSVRANDVPVSGEIRVDGAAAVFTPARPLELDTVYTATIGNGVTDLDGNALASSHTWTFRTEAAHSIRIEATAGPNGSITPGTIDVASGSNQVFTMIPAEYYHVADVLVDDVSVGPVTTYTFTNVKSPHKIVASFAIDTYKITATAGANGSISPSGDQQVNYGSSAVYTIAPAAYHHITDVVVDGISQGAVTSYTFMNVTSPHTITATFVPVTYLITASAGPNGSISPSSGQQVSHGSSTTYTINPDPHYHIEDVRVDNLSQGIISSYTFTNVTGPHSIEATFALDRHTLSAVKSGNGAGSVVADKGALVWSGTTGTTTYDYGTTVTLTANPDSSSEFKGWTGCDSTAQNTCTVTMNNDRTVNAQFALKQFAVTATAGANGSIASPSGTVISSGTGTILVDYGSELTLSILADEHYRIAAVVVDGQDKGIISSYTFTNITSSHAIAVSFDTITHIISASTTTGGIMDFLGALLVNEGSVKSFVLTPQPGFQIAGVTGTCGGTLAGNTYTTNPVATDCTVIASFSTGEFTVTLSVNTENGTILPDTNQTVPYNTAVTFTLTPDPGYYPVMGGTCGGTLAPDGKSYTTNAITVDCTVVAGFSIETPLLTIIKTGNGSGTVTTKKDQIVWSGNTGTANYDYGTTVVLTAAADGIISEFKTWTGCDSFLNEKCTILMTGSRQVYAEFSLKQYPVTVSAGPNGSIILPSDALISNATGTEVAYYNDVLTFTVTPLAGYYAAVGGTCGGTLTENVYTTNTITANCTVDANFFPYSYTVTPSFGGSGSISPGTPQSVNHGSAAIFTLTPDTGFYLESVSGTCGGILAGNQFTTNAVTGNCTVEASFSALNYTVLAVVTGGSGTLNPASQTVTYGLSASVAVIPETGFGIASVTGCGGSLAGNIYTTSAVTGNCTVEASFSALSYTVSAVVTGGSGTVSPVSQPVDYGSNASVAVIPETGFAIASVTGCNGTLEGNTYTTGAVTGDCTVSATFAAITYTVTPSVLAGEGTISPTVSPDVLQTVSHGSTLAFVLAPAAGYHVASINGTCGGTLEGNTYTTSPVTADCTVEANFAIDTYTLSVTKGGNGTGEISGVVLEWSDSTGTASYNNGTTVVLTATTDSSSNFTSWTGCDSIIGNECTVTMTADRSVEVVFTLKQFTIAATAGQNGSISPSGGITVNYGDSPTFTITPNEGYRIAAVTIDGLDAGLISSYTFTNTITDHTIHVVFDNLYRTITTTAGSGGTISPTILVEYGTDTTISITPNQYYHIQDIFVDDVSQGPISSYTFTSVTVDHTISASFAINTYILTVVKDGTDIDTISADPDMFEWIGNAGTASYSHGTKVNLTASPGDGSSVIWTGCDSISQDQLVCTVEMTDAKAITAAFSAQ